MPNAFITFFKTKILRDNQARWNKQYQTGEWDGLKDALEIERQEACRQLMLKHKPQGSILEIGCGEGVFIQKVIQKEDYSSYLGLDVSDFIVQKAQKELSDDKTQFAQGDMDNFSLKQPFDIIFFNESLNYAKSISATLNYCKKHLSNPNAVFIISLHEHKHSPKYWNVIHQNLLTLDKELVKNERAEWRIEALRSK